MTTLLQLRDRAKQESDMVNSSFITDPEWLNLINSSLQEIYGLTAQVYGADYYVQSPSTGYTFTTDGTNQFFALPADFFKLLGIDVLYGATNQWTTLREFGIGDRNKFSAINSPIPAAGQTVRLFYVPRVTLLVGDSTTIPDALSMNGWEEYIIADACIKALTKEESDVSVFMQRKQALIDRINAEAESRDLAGTAAIVDSRGRGSGGMQYRINGSSIWLIGFQSRGWPGADMDLVQSDNIGWW